jgi:hypothetical protein
MKEIKLGTKVYQLMEDVGDINDKRFNYFKMYLLKSLEGIDRPLYADTLTKGIELMNNHKYYQALGLFQNYGQAIEQNGYNEDALSKCFALICLDEGEDQLNVDELYLNKKLEGLWSNGLSRGFVEESVRNFTIESPSSFGAYSLMMAQMTQNLDGEFYGGLKTLQENLDKEIVSKLSNK